MKLQEYIDQVCNKVLFYGFIDCLLTPDDIERCYHANLTVEDAVGIHCDVNTGFTFEEAFNAAINM